MKPGNLEQHEIAKLFPLREGPPLWELAAHIRDHGQLEAIVLYQGQILDGNRRYLACLREKIKPKVRKFGSLETDGADPLEFAIGKNLHRRHLSGEEIKQTVSQKAMLAARLANLGKGKPLNSPAGLFTQTAEKPGDNKPSPISQEKAAKAVGVSRAAVQAAKVVTEHGAIPLKDAVDAGEINIRQAEKIARQPAEVQAKAVEAIRGGEAKNATEAIAKVTAAAVDQVGQTIPPELRGVFAALLVFRKIIGGLAAVSRDIVSLKENLAGGSWIPQSVAIDLANAMRALKFAEPYAACKCKDSALCKACHGRGWVTKDVWERVK